MPNEMTVPQLVAFYLKERAKRWKQDKEEESRAEFGARRLLEIRIELQLTDALKAFNESEICEHILSCARLDINPPNEVKIILGLPQDRVTENYLPEHWLNGGHLWLNRAPAIMSPHVPWWYQVKTTVTLDRHR